MYKFLKFLFSWLLTYSINIWLTFILINFLDFSKDIAYFISILIITLINFFLSLKFIFLNVYSNKLLIKYTFVLIIFSTLNYLSVFFIKNIFPYNYYILIFFVTTIIFFLKFFVYDKYVFNDKLNINS